MIPMLMNMKMNEEKNIKRKIFQKEMQGDLLITDPCYIDGYDYFNGTSDDGFYIKNYKDGSFSASTLFGDWTAALYRLADLSAKRTLKYLEKHLNDEVSLESVLQKLNDFVITDPYFKEIGILCADAGMVGVFVKGELTQKFEEERKTYLNNKGAFREWIYASVDNFRGNVYYIPLIHTHWCVILGIDNTNKDNSFIVM